MSDLVRALAFAFRRKGAESLEGSELRHLLAFDLRWFAPEDAKRVVQHAIAAGFLVAEGDALRPTFDIGAVEVPVNFRPSVAVLDEAAPPALPPAKRAPEPVAAPPVDGAIARAAEDERRRRGLMIDVETARLIVRRRAGEDVSGDAGAAEARLLAAKSP